MEEVNSGQMNIFVFFPNCTLSFFSIIFGIDEVHDD